MKTRTLLFIVLILPLIDVFHSCCNCNIETEYKLYRYKSISLKNLDNSGKEVFESDFEEINKNAYGIRINLTREEVVNSKNTARIQPLFLSSAYATSCECPPEFEFIHQDSIVSVKVLTMYNFNDQRKKDSDISDYFYTAGSFSKLKDIIYYLNTISPYEFESENSIDILLMTPPSAENIDHIFKIQFIYSDGEILEKETNLVKLI